MFIKKINKLLKSPKIKVLSVISVLMFITSAQSDPIIQNEVEDLNLFASTLTGVSPNIVTILDLSGSMGRNFGGSQVGGYDSIDDGGSRTNLSAQVFCENELCDDIGSCNSSNQRRNASHCAEVIANTNVCASICSEGRCNTQEEILAYEQCVATTIPTFDMSACFSTYCGGNTAASCSDNGSTDRSTAANCIGNESGIVMCGSQECVFTCNSSDEYADFTSCMSDNSQLININQTENCSVPGNPNCQGPARNGSSRMDVALSVLLDVLDADDSLKDITSVSCTDSLQQFDGTNSSISCHNYLNTPFRDVSNIIEGLSTLPASDTSLDELIEHLTSSDSDTLGNPRFLPMSYAGAGNGSCTGFRLETDGFQTDHNRVWEFYKDQTPSGGSPLARTIGIDDTDGGTYGDDAIRAFASDMANDTLLDCRTQYMIVITDGDDSCSGDCDNNPSSCTGSSPASDNANRRSAIQAVSNIRTHFARMEAQTGIKKEVIVFVIGLGINNDESIRALNAMALVGGTHTRGIIRHTDLGSRVDFGSVNIDPIDCSVDVEDGGSVLCGSPGDDLEIFRSLARADGLGSNPTSIHLTECEEANANNTSSGHCHPGSDGSTNLFENIYFNAGEYSPPSGPNVPLDLSGFAFLANNSEELVQALNDILSEIKTGSTTGVAPGAPSSSANVGLRDRIFLSILTPIENEKLWQGRLALYGFVDDPNNVGNKIVVKKATQPLTTSGAISLHEIFNENGFLIPDRAKDFHWEAGKKLTERNIATAGNERRIFTVDIDFSDSTKIDTTSSATGNSTIRYTGLKIPFDSNNLAPDKFGISNADVVNPIPGYCQDSNEIVDCLSICDDDGNLAIDNSEIETTDPGDDDCFVCIKACFRDKIVDFMQGNTEIYPDRDAMGGPFPDPDPEVTDEPLATIGFNCPNPDDPIDSSNNFDTCSLRLGDIFHSNPVVVGSPSPLFFDEGFQIFARAYRTRSAAVYVGANDGGVHSFHAGNILEASPASPEDNPFTGESNSEITPFFDEGSGWEMFSFIPPTFLPDSIAPNTNDPMSHLHDAFGAPPAFAPDYRFGDLKTLIIDDSSIQRAFFDGASTIFDVWIDGFDNGIADDNTNICNVNTGAAQVDGKINECGKEWHTVLVSGFRNGGGGLTALDITNAGCQPMNIGNPLSSKCNNVGKYTDIETSVASFFEGAKGQTYPKHLWTLFDNEFGNSWSKPVPGRVRMKTKDGGADKTVDRWLLFVGGGLDPTDTDPTDGVSFGNAFYAIDTVTGKIVYKFHPDNTKTIPDSSDIETIPLSNNIRDAMVCDLAAAPGVFDINADGYVDLAYIGDTCGRVWRFDISKPITDTDNNVVNTGRTDGITSPDNIGTAEIVADKWFASIAFCANTDSECGTTSSPNTPQTNVQPIYFAPTSVIDDIGRRHVIFTTGSRRDPFRIAEFTDPNNTPNNPTDDVKVPGTDEFGRLYNFIDDYIPAFVAGGENGNPVPLTIDMLTADDIVDIIKLEETSPEIFRVNNASTLNNQGEFIVEFPDNFTTTNGEKGVGTPVVINRVLIFTSFAPGEADTTPTCVNNQGEGRVFALDYITGEPALARIPGAESILEGASNKEEVVGKFASQGIPSSAKLTFGSKGSVLLAISFSGGRSGVGEEGNDSGASFLIWELPLFPTRTQTLFWEEII